MTKPQYARISVWQSVLLGGFNAGRDRACWRRSSRCGGRRMQRLLNVHSSRVAKKETAELKDRMMN